MSPFPASKASSQSPFSPSKTPAEAEARDYEAQHLIHVPRREDGTLSVILEGLGSAH